VATEQVFVATPSPRLGNRQVAAPVEFYTTGEDNLRIISVNSQTGVSLKVNARLVTIDGAIDSASWDHTPNSDRTVKTTDFALAPGAVLNLVVFASTGAPQIGQTFVIAQLIRGLGSAATVLGVLFSGYVTATQCMAWPGSPIVSSTEGEPFVRVITGSRPGLGGQITETCPFGARWELVSVNATITTGAAAGTRFAEFVISTPTAIVGIYPNAGGDPATNTTWNFTWGQNVPTVTDNFDGRVVSPFTQRQYLSPADLFALRMIQTPGGDQWSAPAYQVREWLLVG
jgi:hypothetical protein